MAGARDGAREGGLPGEEFKSASIEPGSAPVVAAGAPTAPAPSDAEAIACALGALIDSLLVHLRERRLLLEDEIDEIYETAIRAHRSREGDALSARIVTVLARMQSDGTALRRPR